MMVSSRSLSWRFATAPLLVATVIGCQSYGKLAAVPTAAAVTTPHEQPPSHAEPLAAAVPPAVPPSTPPPAASPPSGPQRPLGPFPQVGEQQALERVLPALKQLAATDPRLHSEVLEQLATTDPSLWGQTVEHAQSKARYKQQLAQRPSSSSQNIQLVGASMPVPTTETATALPPPPPSPQAAARVAAPVFAPPAQSAQDPPRLAHAPTPPSAAPTDPPPRVIENHHATSPPDESRATSTIRLVTSDEPAVPSDLQRLPETKPPATTPVAPTDRDWRGNLDAAITALEADVADSPRSTGEAYRHVRLRLLRLAAGSSEDAVAPPPGLSTTEQSFWSKQLFALSTLLDAVAQRDLGGRAAAAGRHQAEASASLQQMSDLRVGSLTFCDEVYGFGAYEPIDEPRFTAGQSVSLYTEVENYRSDSTEEGYRTSLATSYRVLDRHGALVDSGEFPVVEDLCLSRRRDFHIQYSVALPTTVYPGEYQLELTVTDQLGDKIGDAAVDFEIVAK